MIEVNKPNPFKVLELPRQASNEDIVCRGRELSELATSDEQRLLYRWAVEQLITNPLTRLEHELFEVPGAQYEDPEWDHFLRRHQRNPVNLTALAQKSPPPTLTDFNLALLIQWFLDELLNLPQADLGKALEHLPFSLDCGPPPLEVRHVIFG